MASFNEISVQKLTKLIGTPECPIIIDVRIDEDFNADPELILEIKPRCSSYFAQHGDKC